MKHAFLIIAHNEFEVLQLLVSALDDERNDIYVHIDKKVKHIPGLSTIKSRLFVLKKKVDVRWGNVSQIKAELLLWEEARKNGPYEFYHLISGTHLPLKSQDEIHEYFNRLSGKCIFSNLTKSEGDYHEVLKIHRINICTRGYASPNKFISRLNQLTWKSFIALQRLLGITVNNGIQFLWANNWCSLPQEAIEYLLANKRFILKRYRWSFCGDEWFAPTELNDSRHHQLLSSSVLLFGEIGRSNSKTLSISDYKDIIDSDCLFARKFSSSEPQIIELLQNNNII